MFKKVSIRRILELLRKGLSEREVAKILHASRHTVASVAMVFRLSGKEWDEVLEMDNETLYELFYPDKFAQAPQYSAFDCAYVHSELKKTGVTLKILWEEYCEKCRKDGGIPCSYSTFTRKYGSYTAKCSYTSYIKHRPGETVEVDWSGPTMYYTDPDTGKKVTAYLFVATLPYSQYIYVEARESMTESDWLSCHVNLFSYLGGTPIKVVCDNLKTAVISHPRKGVPEINERYLSLAEHYNVAVFPAAVKKPKQKASVEGSVGKIATVVIARLRNESFSTLHGINTAILTVLRDYNNAPFQKRPGSRRSIFENEEKPYMRELPLKPYEVCEWSYGHKVGNNSHIWFHKGQYSVPYRYIGEAVDVKYNSFYVYLYHNRTEIARHEILPKSSVLMRRTDESHLPIPLKKDLSMDDIIKTAKDIGPATYEVIVRMFENARVKDQPALDAMAVLSISKDYPPAVLEKACGKALDNHMLPSYKDIRSALSGKERIAKKPNEKKVYGIVRGADYYKGRIDK